MTYAQFAGHLGYIISLFLMTGLLMLRLDVRRYELAKMGKEKSVARFLGWLNVALGSVFFVALLAYREW
ncbi:CLC_0170 family protein [Paenibacillus sp. GCM10027626]|uniref:CLC_0170 family protein n=1 Tax=Paenibacillus sp. GCM10027626 TaxID=3273411 RepID=UPI00362F928F